MRSRSRTSDAAAWIFTRSGLAAVAIGVVAYVAGWQLGWVELMVVAAGCLVALVLAVPFVITRSRLELQRVVTPLRVRAGDTSIAELRAVNHARVPMRRVRVEEAIGTQIVPVEIPALGPRAEFVAVYPLPTERRGVMQIGPAVVTRSDPAGLLRRDIAHTSIETLWVHPRWQFVRPLSAGFAKDLEGPTTDDSPAGDIAFHAVRPYQDGDDPRHIHWLSSARAGSVMVRHYVDNRRPHLTIVVDASPRAWAGDEFEVGLQAAASLVMSSMGSRLPVSARVGREWICGRAQPADQDRALDQLTTACTTDDGPLVATVADALRVEPTTSVVAIITARTALADALACVSHARRLAKVIVIDVSSLDTRPPDDEAGASVAEPVGTRGLPGARVLRADTLGGFVAAWNGMMR